MVGELIHGGGMCFRGCNALESGALREVVSARTVISSDIRCRVAHTVSARRQLRALQSRARAAPYRREQCGWRSVCTTFSTRSRCAGGSWRAEAAAGGHTQSGTRAEIAGRDSAVAWSMEGDAHHGAERKQTRQGRLWTAVRHRHWQAGRSCPEDYLARLRLPTLGSRQRGIVGNTTPSSWMGAHPKLRSC